MFYQPEKKLSRAALVLTPEESKRLIAKGVAALPEVQNALRKGIVIIAGGSTNACIAREITGEAVDITRYTIGRIYKGELGATPEDKRLPSYVLVDGKSSDLPPEDALDKFTASDVFLKGANAIDPYGNVGVLAANPVGGTVGAFWAKTLAKGAHIICPVGLEKLVPSVEKACYEAGQGWWDYCMGLRVALMPLAGAKAVTEIEALKALYNVEAAHIASGGIMGSEGAVVLSVKGEAADIELMWREVNKLKNSGKE